MQRTFYDRAAPLAAKAIGILPLAPPNAALALLVKRIVRRHQSVIDRLNPIAGTAFAIDITDLRLSVLLRITDGAVTAQFVRKGPPADVKVSGRLPVLVAMLEGELDGDALFFTRELTISGDTEALLTLRNALDSDDFSLSRELMALSGPLAPVLDRTTAALKDKHSAPQSFHTGHLS